MPVQIGFGGASIAVCGVEGHIPVASTLQ